MSLPDIQTRQSTLTDRLLDAARDTAIGASAPARLMARACLLDWIGCAIAGADDPLVDLLVADAIDAGAVGDCTLAGRRERLAIRDAVLVNGASGHALDYDDGLSAMSGHPSAGIAPAVLELAASLGTRGPDVETAFILAVDTAARVGQLLAPDHYRRGLHATATAGAIGSAAGCAWLLGLEDTQRAYAIGLAATRAAGLKASFGTMAKPLHAGWAALIGLTSAQWARRGFTASPDVLAHPMGLRALSESFGAEAATEPCQPHVLDVRFKRHAACAGTHPTIEAVRALRCKHRLDPGQVASVTIAIDRHLDGVCNQQVVDTGLQAKFSVRMVAAMALAGIDTASPGTFFDAVVADPKLQALFPRTRVELVEAPPTVSKVTVVLYDGTELRGTCDLSVSDPIAEAAAVAPKFLALAEPILGEERAHALRNAVERLEQDGDVREVLRLARPA